MLHRVQHLVEPGQRVLLDVEIRLEAQLLEPAVGDEADVALGLPGIEALDAAQFEGEVDEGVLVLDDGDADLRQFALQGRRPDLRVLLHEGTEQPDDRQAVQRLVAHAPGHDLPHALHLVEAGEVHQDRKGGEQLQAFGEGAEGGEGLGDLGLAGDREVLHVVELVLHLLVLEEGGIFDFRHPHGVEQVGIGGDVDGFGVRERRHHHQHFRRLEHLGVVLHVAVVHLDIRLGEEAEDLRQQVLLGRGQVLLPVLDVVRERHFLRQPVDALLGQPGVIGPWVAERLVDRVGGQQVEADRVGIGGEIAVGHGARHSLSSLTI